VSDTRGAPGFQDGDLARLDAALSGLGTPERAAQEKRYLKSDLSFYGATVGQIRAGAMRGARAGAAARGRVDRPEAVRLVTALWDSPVHEHRMAAIDLLRIWHDRLEPADLPMLEHMLRTSRTWAYVDSLAAEVVGPLVARHGELGAELDRWAADADFWIRRSAMLALLAPLRAGGGDLERFLRYADAMLAEKEFFIRKAIGWVLREVGKKRPEPVVEFLAPRLGRVAGLTLREAVKYLPPAERERLLAGARG
jgi:3-methyladenine DNA glycosylase AlkD